MLGIRTATALTALAGLGSATGGAHLLTGPAAGGATSTAGSATAALTGSSTSISAAAAHPLCDVSAWHGQDGLAPRGRPDGFDRGDRSSTYIWIDLTGWHLRTTDARNVDHVYTGTIALSPNSRFTFFRTVRFEKDDQVFVDGDNVLHYRFNTYAGIDGIDFRVSACDRAATDAASPATSAGGDAQRDSQRLTFHAIRDDHEADPARIVIGDRRQHPDSATFAFVREV